MNDEEKIEYYVTRICNNKSVSKTLKAFLKKCITIQIKLHRTFSSSDFQEITPENFRQRVLRLKNFIKPHVRGGCAYYRVMEVPLGIMETVVTEDPMGDELFLMLMHVKEQPASIHDIKIQFDSNLYNFIVKDPDIAVNPQNNGIILDLELIPNYRTKVLIYPNLVQVNIGCTFNPVVYNIQGVLFLNSLLTLLHDRLAKFGSYCSDLPPFYDWVITHYHFGRDGQQQWSGKKFHIVIRDALHQMIRYYSKQMHDGKCICRFEVAKTPRINISEEMEKMSKF